MSLALLGAEPTRGVLIKVRNASELAASQGGAAGAIAATLAPRMVEGEVLNRVAAELRTNLAKNGVSADVQIVSAAAHGQARSGLGVGVFLGAISTGLLWGLSKLF